MFQDRKDAGRQLSRVLNWYRAVRPLVLCLPRGGVVVGAEVARALGGELDVVLVKKLRAPENPEWAVGAVGEDGVVFVNESVRALTGVSDEYLQIERRQRLAEMAGQRELYRRVRAQVSPAGRTVLVVDDGLATGASMIAAIQTIGLARPGRLAVAVPVGPADTIAQLRAMPGVDEVVSLLTPRGFEGVGQFYRDFTQVTDAEVVELLREAA